MNIDDVLIEVFGEEPSDDSLNWLLWCLDQSQIATIFVMLERNANEQVIEDQGSYRQRAQRILKYLKLRDDDWAQYIKNARAES